MARALQVNEVLALQSMYEDLEVLTPDLLAEDCANEGTLELRVPVASVLEHCGGGGAELWLRLGLPAAYPESAPLALRLEAGGRTGSGWGPEERKEIAARLQGVAEESCGEEAIFKLILELQQIASEKPLGPGPSTGNDEDEHGEEGSKAAVADPGEGFRRVFLRWHHMLSGKQHTKEQEVVRAAQSSGLRGMLCYGKPSFGWAEGQADQVADFLVRCGKAGKKPALVLDDPESAEPGSQTGGKFVLVPYADKEKPDLAKLREGLDSCYAGKKDSPATKVYQTLVG